MPKRKLQEQQQQQQQQQKATASSSRADEQPQTKRQRQILNASGSVAAAPASKTTTTVKSGTGNTSAIAMLQNIVGYCKHIMQQLLHEKEFKNSKSKKKQTSVGGTIKQWQQELAALLDEIQHISDSAEKRAKKGNILLIGTQGIGKSHFANQCALPWLPASSSELGPLPSATGALSITNAVIKLKKQEDKASGNNGKNGKQAAQQAIPMVTIKFKPVSREKLAERLGNDSKKVQEAEAKRNTVLTKYKLTIPVSTVDEKKSNTGTPTKQQKQQQQQQRYKSIVAKQWFHDHDQELYETSEEGEEIITVDKEKLTKIVQEVQQYLRTLTDELLLYIDYITVKGPWDCLAWLIKTSY